MSNHEKKPDDETFVGNVLTVNGIRSELQILKTARLGSIAYDINGNKLPPSQNLPLFVGNSELGIYNRIMTDQLRAVNRHTN